jgi:hypothetical protein
VPAKDSARFVAGMERVLDIDAMAADPDVPLVCMDEASKELHRSVAEPIPAAPGRPQREDDHDERRGVAAVLLFVLDWSVHYRGTPKWGAMDHGKIPEADGDVGGPRKVAVLSVTWV